MRKNPFLQISILAILLLAATAVRAQVLYEISGNSTKAKSYLFATNGMTGIDFLDSVPNLYKCYGRSNKVITEFTMQDYAAIAALRNAALLPDSVTLANFYTDEEYKAIEQSLIVNIGMGFDKLSRMKPAYLTELLRNEIVRHWVGLDEEFTCESAFEIIASEDGKPVYGLDDTGETIYMLFDREPFHWQCEELKKIVEYPEREVALERSIKASYRMGYLSDIAFTIESPDNKSTLSYSDYQVFASRNEQWVKRLRPYLKEGKAFITLNCIYLGGDKGLIQQLRKAGYRVRAVNRRKLKA
ncbi:MAG: TraB/GumN family protein [Paludibacteraceae bacterium]|nr:TraB/GumN family protein [Paludibacteraceae bacterium]